MRPIVLLLAILACDVLGDGTGPDKGQPSYYLRVVRPEGLEVDAMTPRVLTPRKDEQMESCLPACRCIPGDGTYEATVRPYLHAIGDVQPSVGGKTDLGQEAAKHLADGWRRVRAIAEGPVGDRPLRIVTKHYPRAAIPGRCVTLQVSVSDLRDVYLDEGGIRPEILAQLEGRRVDGLLLHVWKTYRLDGETPLLVEAGIEVTPEVSGRMPRLSPAHHLKDLPARERFQDVAFGAHYEMFGGGARWGVVWVDPDASGAEGTGLAYRIDPERDAAESAPLAPEAVEALKALVRRL